MRGAGRTAILTKRLSIFATLPACLFFLWICFGSVFLGWTTFLRQDEETWGSYEAVLNDTLITHVQGVPLEDFIVISRWMAFWASVTLAVLCTYAWCYRMTKKTSFEMNIPSDDSIRRFLSSITKKFNILMLLFLLVIGSVWVTWLVLLKKNAYDPNSYRASSPWDAINEESYQGLSLPPSCPEPNVKLGVHLIGNNPHIWPPTSCSTNYTSPVTTYFCCFALREIEPPHASSHLFSYTLFGGLSWVCLAILTGLYFSSSNWWRRRSVGSL